MGDGIMKIGLITYHSAYNFGSVLQAYATQTVIKRIAGNCEIINYRTKEQKRVYSIFVWSKGWRVLISAVNNGLALLKLREKKKRIDSKAVSTAKNICVFTIICLKVIAFLSPALSCIGVSLAYSICTGSLIVLSFMSRSRNQGAAHMLPPCSIFCAMRMLPPVSIFRVACMLQSSHRYVIRVSSINYLS